MFGLESIVHPSHISSDFFVVLSIKFWETKWVLDFTTQARVHGVLQMEKSHMECVVIFTLKMPLNSSPRLYSTENQKWLKFTLLEIGTPHSKEEIVTHTGFWKKGVFYHFCLQKQYSWNSLKILWNKIWDARILSHPLIMMVSLSPQIVQIA